jgi:hypothetical protein
MPWTQKLLCLHVRRCALLRARSAIESAGLDGFLMRFDAFDVGHLPIMAASRRDRQLANSLVAQKDSVSYE